MHRLIAIAGLLVTIGVAFISPHTVEAQSNPAWVCVFDFTTSNGGFTAQVEPLRTPTNYGSWVNGVGWQRTASVRNTLQNNYTDRIGVISISRSLSSATVTQASLTYTLTKGDLVGFNTSIAPWATNSFAINGVARASIHVLNDTDGTRTLSWTGSVAATSLSIQGYSALFITGSNYGNFVMTEFRFGGTGTMPALSQCAPYAPPDLTRPLSSADRAGYLQSSIDDLAPGVAKSNNNAVAFFSPKNNANINAVASGTVVSVRGLTLFECMSLMTTPPGCGYPLAQGALNPLMPPLTLLSVAYDLTRTYLVEIQSGNFTYIQLVADAPEFVNEGMSVTTGCWIGRTIPISDTSWATLSGYMALQHAFVVSEQSSSTVRGFTSVWTKTSGAFTDRWDDYNLNPPLSAPCNRPAGYEGCLGDYALATSANWGYTPSVAWESPGALLRPGDRIWTNPPLNLVQAREPELIVRGLAFPGTTQSLRLRLGNTTQDFVLSGSTTTQGDAVKIAASASHTPNSGSLYTVEVTNTGTANIRLYYVCPRHTKTAGGTPEPPPTELPPETIPPGELPPPGNTGVSACRFNNADFADGSTGWTLAPVNSVDVGAGEVYVPHTGTIAQTVTLPAGTYPLNIIIGLWTYNGFTDATNTDTVTAEWAYPATTYSTIGTRTFGAFAANGSGVLTLSTNVVIASQTTGTFTIRFTLNNPPSGVRGIAIKAVCLGNSILTTGEGGGGLFTPSCTPIATPTVGAPVGSWISWLWARLNSFFSCDLMLLLNEMYNTVYDGYLLAGWSMRWIQATTQLYTDWLASDFVGWLGGHLANIASGQRVTVVQGAGGCDNIFCAITELFDGLRDVFGSLVTELAAIVNKILDFLIDLLTAVITVLFNLIAGVISLLVWIINEVLRLFRMAQEVLFALVAAWSNATPTPISGLDCASNWEQNGLCLAFWVMDNTVFSGNGEYLIPTLISLSAILLMLWGVKRIRATIMQIGSVA